MQTGVSFEGWGSGLLHNPQRPSLTILGVPGSRDNCLSSMWTKGWQLTL